MSETIKPKGFVISGPETAPTAAAIVPETVQPPTDRVPVVGAHVIGGRYVPMSALGKGGLGEVVACNDVVLQRTVAVKAGQARQLDGFCTRVILEREARIISTLEHPNIIPIYDAGIDPHRGPYYVMRQVTETTLEVILHQRKRGAGSPHDYSLSRLLRYLLQVCNAVDYAHHRGVIHCDIKPANILLGDYGEVLLVDWGLAQSRDHPLGVRGGTLGYMAPEQMSASVERLDWRTDVFALGAILYEIVCGEPAFGPTASYTPPPRPSVRDPRLEIPRDVDQACMDAIAIDREQRLATVRELADAIEDWIEGSKQRARQRIEADKSADTGDELAARYHEFVESRPEQLSALRALRADVEPWAPLDKKQDLWDAEDIVRVTDALRVRTFHSAVSAYERALDVVPGHARARRGLARLYWAELQRARHSGDTLDQIAYEQLLREVDDGTFVRELQNDGAIELTIGEHAGQVFLGKLVERERRLVAVDSTLIAERPTTRRTLPAGRYVVMSSIGATAGTVCWPVNIEAGDVCRINVDPPAECQIGKREVMIPAGPARIAGDPFASEADEMVIVEVPAFLIQRYPVTFREWFAFIDDLRSQGDPQLASHVPPRWHWRAGAWCADGELPIRDTDDPLRIPVFGITAESAEAYARWLAQRDGLAWRLPTELEWEKAGRGTDGRIHPWGDHFDATFCKMRDSRPGRPHAEPIGAFAWDTSPYGVRDLAGGIAEWCIPDPRRMASRVPREVVSRGGAWCDLPIDCRLASRRRYLATEHSARVGVRLVRDP